MSQFGALLRETRKHANLSQEALAEKSGIHDTYISKIETGVYAPPSREIVLKLADALGITDKDERLAFLLAAGRASLADADTEGGEQNGQSRRTKQPRTVYGSILPVLPQRVLLHRLEALEQRLQKLQEMTKEVEDIIEEIYEIRALVEEVISKEKQ